MKKVLSLVLCLILFVLPLGIFAETAEDMAEAYLLDSVEVDKNGNLQQEQEVLFSGSFADVVQYMNYSKTGGVIVVTESVTIDKNTTLQTLKGTTPYILIKGKDICFDLNGCLLTQQAGSGQSAASVFVVPKESALVIEDSSKDKTGTVNGVCGAVEVNGGSLKLANGTFMAQANASGYPDDGELPIKVINDGELYVENGKIKYSGTLNDGRSYYGKSCAVYIDENSRGVFNGGVVEGKIETEKAENLTIDGGTFDFDISDYVSDSQNVIQEGNRFTIESTFPEKTEMVLLDDELKINLDVLPEYSADGEITRILICVSEMNDAVKLKECGTARLDLNEVFKKIGKANTSVELSTEDTGFFAQRIVIDSKNVKVLAEAATENGLLLEMSVSDNAADIVKDAKYLLEYNFVDNNGEKIGADVDFAIELSDWNKEAVELYTQGNPGFDKKEFSIDGAGNSMEVMNGEIIAVTQKSRLEITGRTLDIEGTISIIFYADLSGYEASKVKMLFWDSPQTEYTAETAVRSVSYSSKDMNGYRFVFEDIASKEMNKEIYARLMAVDGNGQTVYGEKPENGYSVVTYAQNMLQNQRMKPLLVKMLNYGTAAQEYFGSDSEAANSSLSEVERVTDYTKIYKSEAEVIGEESFNGECEAEIAGKTLTLEGDISINYYVTCNVDVDEIGIMFWNEKGFNEKEKHIMGTQIKKINTYTNNGSYKVFSYDNITSREMSEPLYARVYTKKDNVYKYGGIHKYNVKDYAAKQIEKNEDAALIKLLRCLLIYGEIGRASCRERVL